MMTYTTSALQDKIYDEFSKPKWTNIIDALRPNGNLIVNILKEPFPDIYTEHTEKQDFVENVRLVVYRVLEERFGKSMNIPQAFARLKISLTSDHHVPMHMLNATDHEGAIVTFDCEVIASESTKSYIKRCTLACPLCGRTIEGKCDVDKKIPPASCPNSSCRGHRLEVQRQTAETENIKSVLLSELLANSKKNSPVVIESLVTGDLIRDIFIGQKKRITGIYRSIFDLKENINELVIDIIAAENLERTEEAQLSEETMKKIKDAMKEPDFLEKITHSYAPHIYGYEIQKKSILLQAVKGNNGIKRANIHILFVGDPSVAKSELLIWNKKVVDISGYISGKGTTEKGITIGIVKEDNGKTYARAGLAPQCNKGVLAIDEMGQMNVLNLSGLHEVMEQRQCSISKAGHNLTLEADTSILGAANPKYGKYDSEETLLENINLPAPLLSRFDLVWLIKDDIVESEDQKKAEHIISTYINPEETTKCFLTPFELSAYLSHVRKLKPRITETVRDKILKIYHQMRMLSRDSTSIAIGTRQLEALVRLSAAHAKLMFRDEVIIDDVIAVQDILKDMYGRFGISLEVGTEFNQTKLIGVSKNESREQTANRVWKTLSDSEGLVKDIHFYKMMEKEDGVTEDDAKKIFGRWEQNCEIKLVKDHFYKKT